MAGSRLPAAARACDGQRGRHRPGRDGGDRHLPARTGGLYHEPRPDIEGCDLPPRRRKRDRRPFPRMRQLGVSLVHAIADELEGDGDSFLHTGRSSRRGKLRGGEQSNDVGRDDQRNIAGGDWLRQRQSDRDGRAVGRPVQFKGWELGLGRAGEPEQHTEHHRH